MKELSIIYRPGECPSCQKENIIIETKNINLCPRCLEQKIRAIKEHVLKKSTPSLRKKMENLFLLEEIYYLFQSHSL